MNNDVTRILTSIEQGDPAAADQLLPLLYQELRKLAASRLSKEKDGQSIPPTMLVHEAYLRLVDPKQEQRWNKGEAGQAALFRGNDDCRGRRRPEDFDRNGSATLEIRPRLAARSIADRRVIPPARFSEKLGIRVIELSRESRTVLWERP